ncbi:MAG: hypothetical protein JWM11_3495 [Planctomycetaceae bacterium]|nr:hypothetical protein [Planctomycetaceae bacterium]
MDTSLRRKRNFPNLSAELLEVRTLLSSNPVTGPITVDPPSDPTDVLSNAADLGSLNNGQDVQIPGNLTRGTEVDWYRFTLTAASNVEFSASSGVLGLYNNSAYDFNDHSTLDAHRLLVQNSSTDTGPAEIQRQLAPGTYFVAVSGLGNQYFSSSIADTGLPGQTGAYTLDITPVSLPLNSSSGAVVLATDISSLAARIDFSQALGFVPTVQLVDATGHDVPLAWTNSNSSIFELQIAPTRAFTAGNYQVIVLDPNGNIRMTVPLDVSGAAILETGLGGNDTPSSAIEIGNLEQQGLVQIAGVIGDDPFYNASSTDPTQLPGNDVDLYHFTVTSTDRIGLQAEVFAGRINSRLDSGLSLYRLDPATGHLQLIAANNNTANATRTADNKVPLAFDSALAAGLDAGDYYIAVSQGRNLTSPAEGQTSDLDGAAFDPELPHSGTVGQNVGAYVLNLRVIPIPDAPEVASVSIPDQSQLSSAPAGFSVQFSEFMNLTQLANTAFDTTSQSSISAVYIQDSLGQKYFPRLTAFDSTTFVASFSVLDRLPAGSYQLHLDGTQGLANIVGNSLVGNTSQGDYVVNFTVAQTNPGTQGDPRIWTHDTESSSTGLPQQLGVLFPKELVAGVTVQRIANSSSSGNHDTSDDYSFQLLQDQSYRFSLSSGHLPAGVGIQVLDTLGNVLAASTSESLGRLQSILSAGSYVLRVGNWPASQSHALAYHVDIKAIFVHDNPPPLFSGPAPAVGLRLVNAEDLGSGGSSSSSFGSNPGGSSFGSIGSSFGTGSSIGGVSSTGAAATDSNGLTSSTFLVERTGSLKITLPANADGVVIAIPTVSGGSLDRSGLIYQATRSVRRASDLKDSLGLIGLAELADGPVGRTGSEIGDSAPALNSMRKLLSLIESSLSSKANDEIADDSGSHLNSQDADDAPTTLLRDTNSLDSDIKFDESSVMRTKEADLSQSVTFAPEMNTPLNNLHLANVRILNDSAFISTVENETPATHLELPPAETATDSEVKFTPDTLFASGIGLLLLDAALRKYEQPAVHVTRTIGSRSGSRWGKLQTV